MSLQTEYFVCDVNVCLCVNALLDDHGPSLAMPDCRVDTKVTWTDDTGDRSDDIHR